jgi:ABC-type cobalamin/Fe3+-siderophores transport system ATPase subunit
LLEIRGISFGYPSHQVIQNASFTMYGGEFLCVLGPNGCGKTTLLKNILGLLSPSSGSILIGGEDIQSWSLTRRAQIMAYIPQAHVPPFPFKVIDVVLTGRTAYLARMGVPGEEDVRIAEDSLAELNISYLKDRIYTKISGGERQLVLIARALAQQPQILIMDEPTANLDFGREHQVLEHLRDLSGKGMSILMVTHDPDQAFYCAHRVVLMKDGGLLDVGIPGDVITEDSMFSMYAIRARIGGIKVSENKTVEVCVPVPKTIDNVASS